MKMSRIFKTAVYSFAGILSISAVIIFWLSFNGSIRLYEDIGETTGGMLAAVLGFEMLFFIAIQALRRKLVPQSMKKYVITIIKHLREYHFCAGALAAGVLLLHLSLTIDITNPWKSHFVTGYITAALIISAILAGLFHKPKRKMPRYLHIIFAISALLPFLFHIG